MKTSTFPSTPTSTLSLNREMSDALGECEPGETKRISLEITVETMGESGLTGTVNSVEYIEPEEEEEVEDIEEDDDEEFDEDIHLKRPVAVSKALKY